MASEENMEVLNLESTSADISVGYIHEWGLG